MSANTLQYELELLKRIAKGNEPAFKLIFELYYKKFFGAAFKMTRCAHTAEEIAQEIFVTLWVKRNCLASAENPSSYLFTIANNCIFAHFKKIAKEKTARQYAARAGSDTPSLSDQLLEKKESREFLESIIRTLPNRQQTIFRLSKQEELSRDEIATRLRISPHTVKNHLQEAVKFIRMKVTR
ncbi:MAG: sigma-70 family RNA polymerase sigma factor [Puia sp.]